MLRWRWVKVVPSKNQLFNISIIGESLQGLGRGDAEFVGKGLACLNYSVSWWNFVQLDVIHSDAGGLGKSEAIGDAGQFMSTSMIELII